MTELNDNRFDDAFRKKVTEADLDFDAEAWAKMEKMLRKRDRFILFRNAAILLLFLAAGLVLYNQFPAQHEIYSSHNKKLDKPEKNKQIQQAPAKTEKIAALPGRNIQHQKLYHEKGINPSVKQVRKPINVPDGFDHHPADDQSAPLANVPAIQNVEPALNSDIQPGRIDNNPQIPGARTDSAAQIASTGKKTTRQKPALSLVFNVGPDFNSASTVIGGKGSLGVGVMANLMITKKLGIQTGLRYSEKRYSASAYNYTFNNPSRRSAIAGIDASCNVLEVPVLGSYTVAGNSRRSIAINAGLSSYFMLRENYVFNYTPQSGRDSYTLTRINQNQHYFSVSSISATYYTKLKKGFQLGIEPYVKIPLTGVGEGKVNLNSSGISLNLRYDIPKKNR
ncbi:PorT family protein [Pedobacter sp. BS3]|uniref:PorT family protein n=1 Tax=Pedobacter sp. BS3 TaxID=2567937 RepID=UPI0011EF77F4|nr:PorT family protein [Pedobacter sp. BS3]TZF82250.1 PorT family protein [Pedobacter sp. BS3]